MKLEQPQPESTSGGLGGIARGLGALCIIGLAMIAILTVLDIIPRSVFNELAGKVLAVGGIALVAGAALFLLNKR